MKPPTIPNPFEKGQVLTAEQLEMLRQACLWAIQTGVVAGPGLVSSLMGNRTVLALQRQPKGATPPHPWKLIKSSTALDVEMVNGILFTSTTGTGACTPQTVSTAALTLTNGTHKIWFKAEVSNAAFATYFVQWQVDAVTVESGAEVPADTLDLTDIEAGAGNVFVEIGEVTAADGVITEITQTLSTPYTLVFPLAIDLEEFECPVEEEPE